MIDPADPKEPADNANDNRVDLVEAFRTRPQPVKLVWSGFARQTVGGLTATGATGKTFYMLESACAVASDSPAGDLLGLNLTDDQRGHPVLYLAAEDPPDVIRNRMWSIGQRLPPDTHATIARNFHLIVATGRRINLIDDAQAKRLIQLAKNVGALLIVLDTLSRMHTLDENNNGQMAMLIALFEWIARETGASVMFLHHVGKAAALGGQGHQQQAARGASAIVDNSRYAAFLTTMTPEEANMYMCNGIPIPDDERRKYVRQGVSKGNYGDMTRETWYVRGAGGVLEPVELELLTRKPQGGRAKRLKSVG